MMEAYVEEVRTLEEHFDGLQTEHVPRVENSIADHLSKCAVQKLPVESGNFVLSTLCITNHNGPEKEKVGHR